MRLGSSRWGKIKWDTNTRPKNKSLTIFHSRKNVLQSWKIAALFNFQDPNHVEDNRSLKLIEKENEAEAVIMSK